MSLCSHHHLLIVLMMLLIPLQGRAEPLLLKNFDKAQKGDYVVVTINKNDTLFHIFDRTEHSFIIEEITVPSSHLPKTEMNWPRWVEQGAPHHTSWVMYEIEPSSGRLLEFFSFTQQGWAEVTQGDHFLTTLLHLNVTKIPSTERKRVGPAPLHRELDHRPLWQPPLFYQNQVIPDVTFGAWRAYWPNDGTELAGKTVDVYLPQKEGPYITYFPYWIEVRDGIAKAKVRLKDSGRQLHSPKTELPRRPPAFIDQGRFEQGKLILRLKTTPYTQDCAVFAIPEDDPWTMPIALTYDKEETREPHVFKLTVTPETLSTSLSAGQRYRFSAIPRNNPRIAAETTKPLTWNSSNHINAKSS